MMLSPEETLTLPAAPAAAKERAEEPCLAVASTVRFFAYTFGSLEAEEKEISAAVIRSKVSQLADTPTETPTPPPPMEGVPVKVPKLE